MKSPVISSQCVKNSEMLFHTCRLPRGSSSLSASLQLTGCNSFAAGLSTLDISSLGLIWCVKSAHAGKKAKNSMGWVGYWAEGLIYEVVAGKVVVAPFLQGWEGCKELEAFVTTWETENGFLVTGLPLLDQRGSSARRYLLLLFFQVS